MHNSFMNSSYSKDIASMLKGTNNSKRWLTLVFASLIISTSLMTTVSYNAFAQTALPSGNADKFSLVPVSKTVTSHPCQLSGAKGWICRTITTNIHPPPLGTATVYLEGADGSETRLGSITNSGTINNIPRGINIKIMVSGGFKPITESIYTPVLQTNYAYTCTVNGCNFTPNNPSNTVVVSTSPATVPDSPRYINATAVSPSRINLSWWIPVNTGGSPITGYKIERSTDGGTTWTTLKANTGSALYINQYSNYFLLASTTYTYKVSAINAIGTSLPSSDAFATTSTATVPDSPRYINATAVSPSRINLSWWIPVNTGGSPITGYKIERSTDGGTTWTTLAANTGSASYINHYSNYFLSAGTTYIYRALAINAIGTSLPSGTTGELVIPP